MQPKQKIGLIILAAGASTRLGKPKQFLKFKGETFLRRAAREAAASVCQPIVAVFGANAEEFEESIRDFVVYTTRNEDWEIGMQTSICVGLEKLLEIDAQISGAVLAVCDQPFVTGKIFDHLAETFAANDALIVASRYAGTLGVPALFSRKLFPDLRNLRERGGAKVLIKQHLDETIAVDFADGAIDIDTPEDFERLGGKLTIKN